jgi:hypothetical protein
VEAKAGETTPTAAKTTNNAATKMETTRLNTWYHTPLFCPSFWSDPASGETPILYGGPFCQDGNFWNLIFLRPECKPSAKTGNNAHRQRHCLETKTKQNISKKEKDQANPTKRNRSHSLFDLQ